MQINKDNQGKWIYPTYDKFLTNATATSDKEKVVVKQVYIPAEESADEWIEISQEDVDRIRQAKGQTVGMPEEVSKAVNFTTLVINKVELTDEESLAFKELYPTWESMVGKSLSQGFKARYDNKLYKVKQTIETVLKNQPPSIDTAALYEEINETAAGTKEDPIPYNNNMELFNGKYYIQNGIIYYCNRNTEQAVYHNLADLVNIYVTVAE